MEYKITDKRELNSEEYLIEVNAPIVAKKFKAGNFVVIITHTKGERIPLSVFKVEDGKVSMILKKLGKTSYELDNYKVGDTINAVIGPLGKPIKIKSYGNVVVASDLVCGHAENYSISKALNETNGNHVISMQTFPTKDKVYLENELRNVSNEYHITTLDGSYGAKGHYIKILEQLLKKERVDMVFAGGHMETLKELSNLLKSYGIPGMVTLRPIMVDGTGMCGSCRVFIDNEMKLACIDGPMFDAHKVNFDEVINSMDRFKTKEKESMDNYKHSGR